MEAQGGAVRGVADAALQAAVGLHFGVAYLELSASLMFCFLEKVVEAGGVESPSQTFLFLHSGS